jgi:hypothetical protein
LPGVLPYWRRVMAPHFLQHEARSMRDEMKTLEDLARRDELLDVATKIAAGLAPDSGVNAYFADTSEKISQLVEVSIEVAEKLIAAADSSVKAE